MGSTYMTVTIYRCSPSNSISLHRSTSIPCYSTGVYLYDGERPLTMTTLMICRVLGFRMSLQSGSPSGGDSGISLGSTVPHHDPVVQSNLFYFYQWKFSSSCLMCKYIVVFQKLLKLSPSRNESKKIKVKKWLIFKDTCIIWGHHR